MCIAGMRFPEGGVYLERSLGYGVHAHRPYIHNADLTVLCLLVATSMCTLS